MEHYDVEDAFNRMGAIELELVRGKATAGERSRGQQNWETLNFTIRFSLKNDSRLSAAAPYVWTENSKGAKLQRAVTSPPSQRPLVCAFSDSVFGERQVFTGEPGVFIHPGLAVPVFDAILQIGHYLGSDEWHHEGKPLRQSVLSFDFGFGCQNSRMKTGRMEWRGETLADLLEA
jgi:hypothetical protein